jgi:hypothetical protein
LLKTGALLAAALIYAQVVWFLFERRTRAIREWLIPGIVGHSSKVNTATHV